MWCVKKLLTILLLFTYFIASGGANIHVHYCGGEFAGWNVGNLLETKECSGCGMKTTEKGCCEDKQIIIKTSDNHKPAYPCCTTNFHFDTDPAFYVTVSSSKYCVAKPYKKKFAVSPPGRPFIIYKVNCALLI